MGGDPAGDVQRGGEVPEGDPAGVDLVDHHEDFLTGGVDEDVAEVVADAGEGEVEGLISGCEGVVGVEGDLGDGTEGIVCGGELGGGVGVGDGGYAGVGLVGEEVGGAGVVGVGVGVDEVAHGEVGEVGDGILEVVAGGGGRVDDNDAVGGDEDEGLVGAVGDHVGALAEVADAVAGAVERDLVFDGEGAVQGEKVVVDACESCAGQGGASEEEHRERWGRGELHGDFRRMCNLKSDAFVFFAGVMAWINSHQVRSPSLYLGNPELFLPRDE